MTEAADTRGTVPTASVFAQGASRDSNSYQLAPDRSDWIAAGSQPLRRKQRGCFVQSVIDLLAMLFGAFLILLVALCIICAPIALLFLFLMFV